MGAPSISLVWFSNFQFVCFRSRNMIRRIHRNACSHISCMILYMCWYCSNLDSQMMHLGFVKLIHRCHLRVFSVKLHWQRISWRYFICAMNWVYWPIYLFRKLTLKAFAPCCMSCGFDKYLETRTFYMRICCCYLYAAIFTNGPDGCFQCRIIIYDMEIWAPWEKLFPIMEYFVKTYCGPFSECNLSTVSPYH